MNERSQHNAEAPQENSDKTESEQRQHSLTPRVRAMFNSQRPKVHEDALRYDSISAIFSNTAQWAVQNFGDSPETWKIVEHLLVARGYAYAASFQSEKEHLQALADEQSTVLYNLKDFLETNGLDVWAQIGDPSGLQALSEEDGGTHNIRAIAENQVVMMDRAKVIMDEEGFTKEWNDICSPVNRQGV